MENGSLTSLSIENHEANTASLDPTEFCGLLLSRPHLLRGSRLNDWANVVVEPGSGKRYQVDAGLLRRYIESLAS
jgi:hypothetical protein